MRVFGRGERNVTNTPLFPTIRRDGHLSDYVLLWGKQNIILLKHVIRQMGDEAEAKRSSQRLDEILDFVETPTCRHREVCLHFGETPRWSSCKSCDACGYLPEWLAEPRKEKAREREKKFKASGAVRTALAGVDAELADYLHEWRRAAAEKQGMPAFVIMHDSSLEDLCRKRPRTLAEVRQVSGLGERKTAVYGREILAALERFAKGARAGQIALPMSSEIRLTLHLPRKGFSFDEAAKLVESGSLEFDSRWVAAELTKKIREAAERLGLERLSPIKAALPPATTDDEVRLVVAHLRAQKGATWAAPDANREIGVPGKAAAAEAS